jgi:hypothetical protein
MQMNNKHAAIGLFETLALDDKSKVAILATEDDLKMLIRALHTSSIDGAKEREMERDLIQIRSAAFPPNAEVSHRRADVTK